jgi:RNA polymerase sigma factor (TIGR02999 family)
VPADPSTSASRDAVTQLLKQAATDPAASARLLPLVYHELRLLAAQRLSSERVGHTLQPTALVHEAYLRLVGPESDAAAEHKWDHRGHFFAAAAHAMRRVLIDHARARAADKRGGGRRRTLAEVSLDAATLALDDDPATMLDLDAALTQFALEEPAKAQLVQLRFFGGLTLEQAAKVAGISAATADRHWAYARAWLFDRLSK